VSARHEAVVIDRRAKVSGLRVGNHLACVVLLHASAQKKIDLSAAYRSFLRDLADVPRPVP